MAENPTPWQLAADEVLAACMAEVAFWQRARFEHGLMSTHFPPGVHRMAFLALDELRIAEQPTTLTALVDATNGKVALEWWAQRGLLTATASVNGTLRKNIDIMRTRAQAFAHLTALLSGAEALKNAETEEERRGVVAQVVTALGSEMSASMADATALAAGERFAELMGTPPQRGIPTAVHWLDAQTGGVSHGEIWWIAAAYKMRKSSLMRNMALGAARSGASATVITLESPQSVLVAQFVAMLAAEWMLKEGCYNDKDRRGLPLNAITAKQLLAMRNSYKTVLDKRQVAAVGYGITEYKRLARSLRVYDATPQNGGVSTLADVQTLLLRDKNLYSVDVVMLDYLQRLSGRGDSIFDRISQQALELQSMALKHNVGLVVLAQRNEETIKGKSDEHSPGVKGGGDPAATADYLFITKYPVKRADGTADKDVLEVELRLARHGEAGSRHEFPLHAPSGWLVPEASMVKPPELVL